jgi:hypothetical protein
LGIDLDTDEKEKENQSDIGDEVEVRHGWLGKDGIAKVRDATHDGRTEDDATNDLCNDFGLLGEGKDVSETLGKEEDDYDLDDKDGYGLVVSVYLEWTIWLLTLVASYSTGLRPVMTLSLIPARRASELTWSAALLRKVDMIVG